MPALVQRIAALDFSRPPAPRKPENPTANPRTANLDPHHYSGVMLEMVRILNATEALPALLQAEEQLRGLLEIADTRSEGRRAAGANGRDCHARRLAKGESDRG